MPHSDDENFAANDDEHQKVTEDNENGPGGIEAILDDLGNLNVELSEVAQHRAHRIA